MTFKHKLSKRLALMRDEALALPLAFHPIRSKHHAQSLDTVAFVYSKRPSHCWVPMHATLAVTTSYTTLTSWHKGCLYNAPEARVSRLLSFTNTNED
jgi:hypothetical protein